MSRRGHAGIITGITCMHVHVHVHVISLGIISSRNFHCQVGG